jgi:hypothetical protein
MHANTIHTGAHRAKTTPLAPAALVRLPATLSTAELRRIVADILG